MGGFMIAEVARLLKENKNKLPFGLYITNSVQEEVGMRGAIAASFNVQPDIGIAFDVTPSGDVINPITNFAVKLGGGAAIKIRDMSVMCDRKLVESLVDCAKKNNVPHQIEILAYGGTDTAAMQTVAGGSRAGCISIPVRFCHSQNEVIDMKDVEACVQLGTLACSFDL